MVKVITRVRSLMHRDEGQDLIEYALIAGLIALVAVIAIGDAGTKVNEIWVDIVAALNTVP